MVLACGAKPRLPLLPPSRRRPFGLDEREGSWLGAFAVHPSEREPGTTIEGLVNAMMLAGINPGPMKPCSRARTDGSRQEWRFTSAWEALDHKPFVIEWDDPDEVSERSSAPRGCTLVRLIVLTASHAEAHEIEDLQANRARRDRNQGAGAVQLRRADVHVARHERSHFQADPGAARVHWALGGD